MSTWRPRNPAQMSMINSRDLIRLPGITCYNKWKGNHPQVGQSLIWGSQQGIYDFLKECSCCRTAPEERHVAAVNEVQKPSNCSEFAWFYFPDRLHCSTQTHSLLNTKTNKNKTVIHFSMTHRNDCSRNAHNNRSIFLFAPGHLLLLDSILLKAYVNDVLM